MEAEKKSQNSKRNLQLIFSTIIVVKNNVSFCYFYPILWLELYFKQIKATQLS